MTDISTLRIPGFGRIVLRGSNAGNSRANSDATRKAAATASNTGPLKWPARTDILRKQHALSRALWPRRFPPEASFRTLPSRHFLSDASFRTGHFSGPVIPMGINKCARALTDPASECPLTLLRDACWRGTIGNGEQKKVSQNPILCWLTLRSPYTFYKMQNSMKIRTTNDNCLAICKSGPVAPR